MSLWDEVSEIFSRRTRESYQSGETAADIGEAILGLGQTAEERARIAAVKREAENMGYLDFIPDIFQQALSYSTTGEEPAGPFSLEELSRRQQAVEDAPWDYGGLSEALSQGLVEYQGPMINPMTGKSTFRRRRRRRGCGRGYKRVTSCRCACKRRRRGRRHPRSGRRRARRRMPAALARYWAGRRRRRRR